MSTFMNEYGIDEAADYYARHPVLGPATRLLAAYRDEVNRKSDGWPYWGHRPAGKLMALIEDSRHWAIGREPGAAEIARAIAPIKAFCTKKGLAFPVIEIAA